MSFPNSLIVLCQEKDLFFIFRLTFVIDFFNSKITIQVEGALRFTHALPHILTVKWYILQLRGCGPHTYHYSMIQRLIM